MPSLPDREQTMRLCLRTAVAALVAAGYGLTLLIFSPGIMTYDAKFVHEDIARGVLGDWQSPVMTVLWGLIDPVAPGAGSMFLLIATSYWLAFGLLGWALAGEKAENPWGATLFIFWSMIDDLLNTFLYVLIGLLMLAIDLSWQAALAILLAVPLALLARMASVGVPMLVLDRKHPGTVRAVGVLTWAGLRGGVSIALALVLPETPYRSLLLAICFGVVIFTVIVQGLLLPRVIAAFYGSAGAG